MDQSSLLLAISHQYLASRDFNGLPLRKLSGDEHKKTRSSLRKLVEKGLVTIVFGDIHPNPHVRALPDEPLEIVLEKLDRKGVEGGCAYPTRSHLETLVSVEQYPGKPYAYELALGGAQLSYRAFDLQILEYYRNDPRFHYQVDDIRGQIYAHEGAGVPERDDAYLRFGFAYDDASNMYVAVYLWDLFKLPPETQQMWRMRESAVNTGLHPDFHRTTAGHFPERLSIYEAFLMELAVLNSMAEAIGKPALFRKDYRSARPKEFAALLRPTVREFNNFVQALDKMLSDNINSKFFEDEVAAEHEVEIGDGKVRVDRKGTIQMLEEWVFLKFAPRNPKAVKGIFDLFREVRKLRSKPAHTEVEDRFDTAISADQRDLMNRSYKALRGLRTVIGQHPLARDVEIDDILGEARIWLA